MQLLINVSDYDLEYIRNMYDIPKDISVSIAEALLNGREIPPHGRLIDKDKLRHDLFVNFNGERIPFYDCDNFPTKISYRDLHSILAEQKTVIEAERNVE